MTPAGSDAVPTTAFDAVVPAGGAAHRLDGTDKPALRIGDATLLDRVLAACADAGQTVCVGPRRAAARPVRWTRESPPGGGPVAALAAGLALVGAQYVAVLAADLPFLDGETVRTLVRAAAEGDGAVLVDRDGRDQWLAGCYRRAALAANLACLRAQRGSLSGASLKTLVSELDLCRVPDPGGLGFDCDTWEDVRHVRRLVEDGRADLRAPRTESDP